MAAEYLEKAGRKLGVNVVVEKQGANGIEGRITAQQLQEAKACIFAAEVAIKERERFQGIPAISVPVAEPLRHAEALIERALALQPVSDARPAHVDTDAKKCVKTELKQALLSGISFAVPLIVAGGTVLAVSVLLAQIPGLAASVRSGKFVAVDVPQTGRRDARYSDGACSGGLHRLLAGG